MSDALIHEMRNLADEMKALRMAMSGEVATAELCCAEDPLQAKVDEMITKQKRTNELLEALLKISESVAQGGTALLTAVT